MARLKGELQTLLLAPCILVISVGDKSQSFSGGAPCQQAEDGGAVARLKGELQALLLAMQERIQSLETVQEQQDSAIQVIS